MTRKPAEAFKPHRRDSWRSSADELLQADNKSLLRHPATLSAVISKGAAILSLAWAGFSKIYPLSYRGNQRKTKLIDR